MKPPKLYGLMMLDWLHLRCLHRWKPIDLTWSGSIEAGLRYSWTRQRCIKCGVEGGNVLGPGETIELAVSLDELVDQLPISPAERQLIKSELANLSPHLHPRAQFDTRRN